ncbi:MAG: non-canonical purine NTP pyrophosphatase [Candidatus Nanohaloarchaea archaeon]
MKKIYFATGNPGKVEEMQPLFQERGFELEQVEVDVDEIDALDVEEVAEQKAIDSFEDAGVEGMLIVEDTGFYVETLEGFPGAKAAFFDMTVGASGILDLMQGEEDRPAYFKTAIAVCDGDDVRVFTGRVDGELALEKRGESHPHLPYDSYFIPDHGPGKSFAEDPELKRQNSQRKQATLKLLDWLENQG